MTDLETALDAARAWLDDNQLLLTKTSLGPDFAMLFALSAKGTAFTVSVETDDSAPRPDFQQRANRFAGWRMQRPERRRYVVFAPPGRMHTEMVPMARFDQIIAWPRQRATPAHRSTADGVFLK